MSDFFVLLVGYGLMFSVRDALITATLRRQIMKVPFFAGLLSCAFCTGFWTSLASAWLCGKTGLTVVISYGLAGAAFCMLADAGLTYIENAIANQQR